PAIFCWTLASDMVPHPDLESRYIEILKSCDPTRPSLNSTGGVGSEQAIVTSTVIESDITGSSGLKMLGPYAYTPPVYWYTDKRLGGAYGFNSETCPGANVPPIDSLRKMLSEENLWPMNSAWDFHGGRNAFATLDRIVEAIAKRYGTAESAEDFAFKAQVLNYELMRPMFEAFQINHPRATGIIQWMLNAAWPKTSWQLYDQYLRPNGAFYGAKKGCTPQKLAYNYGDGDVYFVDEYAQNNTPKIAWIRQYDTASQLLLEETVRIKPKSGTTRVFRLKRPNKLIFLDLRLLDADCDELHHNFYWLAPTPDVLNYGAKFDDWAFYTPTKSYANFHDLNKMPKTSLDVDAEMSAGEHDIEMSVEITNHSEILAFFNEFIVIDPSSDTHVLPSNWSDNYISLLPGESRKVRVSFPRHAIGRVDPIIALNGWNLD
ncbi:glycoside hydrolase family 2, partial [candidate division KSB1 bacterium]|nr:glycoside hydrolase family 2 [candidate division KSB1 bacterium]